jgi:hypothetical protein
MFTLYVCEEEQNKKVEENRNKNGVAKKIAGTATKTTATTRL